MRLSLATALVGTVALATSVSTSAGAARVPVTFVGDSVPASITYVAAAQARLQRGLRVRLDLEVCRRLVQPSCRFQGATPTTALQAVKGYGRSLGTVLVVNVGYNEDPRGYGDGIDRVMRSALAQGARGVVWVTLREVRGSYHGTNVAIRAAARRWPQLVVADWNAYSSGRPWFGDDGLHLTNAGASGLVAFLRPFVLRAAGSPAS